MKICTSFDKFNGIKYLEKCISNTEILEDTLNGAVHFNRLKLTCSR